MENIIVCDVDGTITPSLTLEMHEELRRRGFDVDLASYGMGVPHHVLAQVHDDLADAGVLLKCELYEGAREALELLAKRYRIVYGTARSSFKGPNPRLQRKIEADTRATLKRLAVPYADDVVFCKPPQKGLICIERRASVIIEDSHTNLLDAQRVFYQQGYQAQMILIEQLYNRDHGLENMGVIEVPSFSDVIGHLVPVTNIAL